MVVNKSKICCRVSANSGTPSAARKVRRAISGAVAGIDTNVTFGEIAGPEARASRALAADLELDRALRLIELLLEARLGKLRRQSAAAHGRPLHDDIDLPRIESHARIPRGRENAPPVGIAARDRRLDQWRVGNASGDSRRRVFGSRAGYVNSDQLPRAFSVSCDLPRQRFHH